MNIIKQLNDCISTAHDVNDVYDGDIFAIAAQIKLLIYHYTHMRMHKPSCI